MIDDKAKKCPKCQADQRNWFAKHPVITVILGIFLLMAIFGSSKNKNNTTGTKLSSENKVVTSETLLSKNNPDLKQISMMTMDYVDQPLTMYVKAEGCDYYNYEFRDETRYYCVSVWDNSTSRYDNVYSYIEKKDPNAKDLMNKIIKSTTTLKIEAIIPKSKYRDGSNCYLQINSWEEVN